MSTLDQQWANYGQQAIVFVQPAAKNRFYIWEKKTVFTFGKKKSREEYFFLVTHVHYIKFKFQSPEIVPLELSHAHVLTCYGCFWATRILLNCCKRLYGLQTWKYLLSSLKENILSISHCFGPFELLLLLHNKYSSADFIIQNKKHNEYNLPTHMLKKYNIML